MIDRVVCCGPTSACIDWKHHPSFWPTRKDELHGCWYQRWGVGDVWSELLRLRWRILSYLGSSRVCLWPTRTEVLQNNDITETEHSASPDWEGLKVESTCWEQLYIISIHVALNWVTANNLTNREESLCIKEERRHRARDKREKTKKTVKRRSHGHRNSGRRVKIGYWTNKKVQTKENNSSINVNTWRKWNKTHKAKYQRPNLVWSKLTDPCTDDIKVCLHVCFSMRPGVCCHWSPPY